MEGQSTSEGNSTLPDECDEETTGLPVTARSSYSVQSGSQEGNLTSPVRFESLYVSQPFVPLAGTLPTETIPCEDKETFLALSSLQPVQWSPYDDVVAPYANSRALPIGFLALTEPSAAGWGWQHGSEDAAVQRQIGRQLCAHDSHECRLPFDSIEDASEISDGSKQSRPPSFVPKPGYEVVDLGKMGKFKMSVGDSERDCPIVNCNSSANSIQKHLKQVHHMKPEAASHLVNVLKAQTRNEKRDRRPSGRLVDKYVKCPNCERWITRLDRHSLKCLGNEEEKSLNLHLSSSSEDTLSSDWDVEIDEQAHVTIKTEDPDEDKDLSLLMPPLSSGDEEEISECNSDSTSMDFNVDKETSVLLNNEFHPWIMSPSGGKLSKGTSTCYVNGCHRAIAWLGGSITSIGEYEKLGLPSGLMEIMENDRKSAMTIRVMIYGVLKLVEFLQVTKNKVFSTEQATTALATLKNYSKSLSRDVRCQRQRKKRSAQDEVDILLPRMAHYVSSKHYHEAKSIIARADEGLPVSSAGFRHLKSYIITQLMLASGHRVGVVTNCLMSEYKGAKKQCKSRIITVENHKTAYSGEARFVVSTELWKELATYATLLSDRFEAGKYLFPSLSGGMMQSNNVNRCLTTALNIKTTASLLRKSIVVLHKETGASKDQMADLAVGMCHKTVTQEEYYDVSRKDKMSLTVSEGLIGRLQTYKVCSRSIFTHTNLFIFCTTPRFVGIIFPGHTCSYICEESTTVDFIAFQIMNPLTSSMEAFEDDTDGDEETGTLDDEAAFQQVLQT
jgi:integrase